MKNIGDAHDPSAVDRFLHLPVYESAMDNPMLKLEGNNGKGDEKSLNFMMGTAATAIEMFNSRTQSIRRIN